MDLYRQQVTQVHKACTLKLYSALKDLGLAVAEPKGAFYLYPSFHPYTKQLKSAGIHTSVQLSRWLIEECGVAALPGSVFGEDDEGMKGGRYRLRMSTSYLYFKDREERYTKGYALLEKSIGEGFAEEVELPLLNEAIGALRKAVEKVKSL